MHGGIRGLSFNVPSRPGWHRHHLIPREIYRYPDLARFVAGLEQYGFVIGDFCTNGMFLPSDPAIARQMRLPLHNGPHKTYNNIVIANMERLRTTVEGHRSGRRISACVGNYYQLRLRRDLVRAAQRAEVVLASRDPFGCDPRLDTMDTATVAMFEAALDHVNRLSEARPSGSIAAA